MPDAKTTVVFICNRVTGGWSPDRLDEVNASEEAIVRVAESLAASGMRVVVHQNGAACEEHRGVRYRPREEAPEPNPDVLVLFKCLDHWDKPARAKIFWTIDSPAPGAAASWLPPRVASELTAVLCASEWHRQQILAAVPWLPPDKAHAHWLGVNKEEIDVAVAQHPKVRGRVVYASSPDRGLHELLRVWPNVMGAHPGASLHVLYGFDFYKKSEAVVSKETRAAMVTARRAMEKLLRETPGVTATGRLPRAEYLKELAEAEVWAYPCNGGELCCVTGLEAQAARCLPVVVPTMALRETVQVGYKVAVEHFEEALCHALEFPDGKGIGILTPIDDWDGVKLPSWDDLATFLHGLFESALAPAVGTESKAALPVPITDPVPERFAVPAPATFPKVELDVVMCVMGMKFDGNTDRTQGLGGSETMAVQLARSLVKRGHRVTVFSDCDKPGRFDDVQYAPITQWPQYASSTPHDVSLVQRDPTRLAQPLKSRLNLLWCHDLGLTRYVQQFRAALWNVDYVVPVSNWHGRQLCDVYGLEAPWVAPMRNGIELATIQDRRPDRVPRDPKALVYTSRPERGLDLLLERVFPRLLERDPQLTLYVAGYDNTVEHMRPFYEHCATLLRNLGDRARWVGHLKKADLYALYRRARALIYPTRGFEEVSCVTLMEAAACGLPVVATTMGALPETSALCPGAAELVPYDGNMSEGYVQRFVDTAWSVISDDLKLERMRKAGVEGAKAYDWAGIAEEWERFAFGALEQRSADARRLARHFWRLGDWMGAAKALERHGAPITAVGEVLCPSSYADAAEDLPQAGKRRTLDQNGAVEWDAPPLPVPSVEEAVRVGALAGIQPKTVRVLGPHAAVLGPQVAAAVGGRVAADGELADFTLGIETLDCAPDPEQHIKDAEALTVPGGHVCLVTASIGVYQDRLRQGYPRRARWVLDQHDMRDLLGKKEDMTAYMVGGGMSSGYDGQLLSWGLYRWRRTSADTSRGIDWARRLAVQAPALSVSLAMITHNAEGMLHRALKSARPYADEILVDDMGSTDSTRAIAERYGAFVADGMNPREHGFDAARNHGLRRVTGDLVLWIDSDEELLDTVALPKYFRWNLFGGYGVKQHHFSAVPENAFRPDLPVRIFRRQALDGSVTPIRWWGVVHEHPEIEPNLSVGQSIILSDVHIAHDGYLTETVRRQRFDRNIALMFKDRAKYPQRHLGRYLMVRDWVHLARYAVMSAGNRLTPEAAEYLEAAIKEFREGFLGQVTLMGTEGLQYYNQSLEMLGRGFEADIRLQVKGLDGQPRDFAYKGRVADRSDLMKLLGDSAAALASGWEGKYL